MTRKSKLRDMALLLPHIAILLARLAADKRIPSESKMAIVAAAAYFVSPIDLIPDFVPVLGQMEDLMVLLLLVDGVINHLDPEIVREHWSGDPEMLRKISSFAAKSTRFIPGFVKNKLFHRTILGGKIGGSLQGRKVTGGVSG
jgi:uncharacterized membrane protein YkvA (DUF1232 family)